VALIGEGRRFVTVVHDDDVAVVRAVRDPIQDRVGGALAEARVKGLK
jgi:hypothetical protein